MQHALSGHHCIPGLCTKLASCPGSNYAGEGKRAWYLPFAVVKII